MKERSLRHEIALDDFAGRERRFGKTSEQVQAAHSDRQPA